MRGLSLENIISACRGDYFGDVELLRKEIGIDADSIIEKIEKRMEK